MFQSRSDDAAMGSSAITASRSDVSEKHIYWDCCTVCPLRVHPRFADGCAPVSVTSLASTTDSPVRRALSHRSICRMSSRGEVQLLLIKVQMLW